MRKIDERLTMKHTGEIKTDVKLVGENFTSLYK